MAGRTAGLAQKFRNRVARLPTGGRMTRIHSVPASPPVLPPPPPRPPDVAPVTDGYRPPATELLPPPPDAGGAARRTPAAVIQAGRAIAAGPGGQALSLEGDYRPLNPAIAGRWRGRWKCNLLVGDALYLAGHRVPTIDLGVPGKPHLHVEAPSRFHRHRDCFTPVTGLERLQPGDVITIAYPPASPGARRDSHAIIVTGIERDAGGKITRLVTLETTRHGVRESPRWTELITRSHPVGDHLATGKDDGYTIRLLRPR
jgi:hypothetical protein